MRLRLAPHDQLADRVHAENRFRPPDPDQRPTDLHGEWGEGKQDDPLAVSPRGQHRFAERVRGGEDQRQEPNAGGHSWEQAVTGLVDRGGVDWAEVRTMMQSKVSANYSAFESNATTKPKRRISISETILIGLDPKAGP